MIASPLEQFKIHPILSLHAGNLDFSITNSTVYMLASVGLFLLLCGMVFHRGGRLIPSLWQCLLEMLPGIEDDVQFAQAFLDEKRVFVLPGSCFGMSRTGSIVYFRVVIAAPSEKLQEAYKRMADFIQAKSAKRRRVA